jgi:hypothetical protein
VVELGFPSLSVLGVEILRPGANCKSEKATGVVKDGEARATEKSPEPADLTRL